MLKHLAGFGTPAPRAGIDSVLVIDRHQARWLVHGHAGLYVAAQDEGESPASSAVAAALRGAAEVQRGRRLFVVIGAAEYRIAHESLPRTSRREREFMLQTRLAERLEEADLRMAQPEPGAGKGMTDYRLSAVSSWSTLEEWWRWLATLECELAGPFFGACLAADAAYRGRAAEAGSRIAVIHSASSGAWVLAFAGGRLRLVRCLDADLCGGTEPRERGAALAQQVGRTRDWLLGAGHLAEGASWRLDVMDAPEVMAAVSEAVAMEASVGPLGDLCQRHGLAQDVPAVFMDALCWAALQERQGGTPPVLPIWANKRREARRARSLRLGWVGAAGLAGAGLVFEASSAVMAWRQLDALQSSLKALEPELQANEARRKARSETLRALAGGTDPEAFENQAKAYRALVGPSDQLPELTRLLQATAEALGRSSVQLHRIRLNRESAQGATSLELAVSLPRSVERPDALGELRHVAGMLEGELPTHRVRAQGLETPESAPNAGAAPAVARPVALAISPPASTPDSGAGTASGETLFTLLVQPKK